MSTITYIKDGVVHVGNGPYPDTAITKRAFQNRFPLAANGISTKYDVMAYFLIDDGYANNTGLSTADIQALRLLIVTGQNRLDSSGYVDLVSTEQAAQFTYLLTGATGVNIPADFKITLAERNAILNNPIQDKERPS